MLCCEGMFGMGMGELLIIAVVALLALGPDKLPEAAKKIGEVIRGLRKQTTELRKTIEDDTQLGDAMREIRSAMREDPLRDALNDAVDTAKAGPPPASGPAPEEGVTDEPLVQPAEDAVSRDDVAIEPGEGAEEESQADAQTAPPTAEAKPPSKNIELSQYERYIHVNGTQAAADKFGTTLEHAEAAMTASLERATHDG